MQRAVSTLPVRVLQYDSGYGVSLRRACATSGCLLWSFRAVVSRFVMIPAMPMSCSRLVCHFLRPLSPNVWPRMFRSAILCSLMVINVGLHPFL